MIADLASEHAERLDVTGSHLLDDYVPGVSDLDLVGVLSREPTSTDLAALAETHVGSKRTPCTCDRTNGIAVVELGRLILAEA